MIITPIVAEVARQAVASVPVDLPLSEFLVRFEEEFIRLLSVPAPDSDVLVHWFEQLELRQQPIDC